MPVVGNRIKVASSSTGTGNITLGSAEDGYQTFAAGGISNNDVVRYVITEGSAWEIGKGTYLTSGPTLTRTSGNLLESSTGSLLNLGGSATVFVSLADVDVMQTDGGTFTGDVAVNGTVTAEGLTVDTDTLYVDATNNRVGINTTSPTNELHVSNRADFMIDVDGDDAAAIFKEVGGDAWRIGYRSVQNQFRIAFDEASLGTNVRVAMTTGGNVGIGTVSPSQKLDVSGNIAVSGTVDGVDIATRDGVLTSTTTTANAAMPKTGGTFTGDVTFTGASYNAVWDKSDSALEFADNAKAAFGTGSDMLMYHNGSNSYLVNYTGVLYITNYANDQDVIIKSDNGIGGSTNYFLADGSTGEVQLYAYGSPKLKTQSSGIDVTGNITVSGTVDGRDIATNIPSSLGTAGQVLTVNAGATAGEWADVSASANDDIFWENGQTVSSNYTITNGKNAMSAGPITIASGVTVTVGDGETWTVV